MRQLLLFACCLTLLGCGQSASPTLPLDESAAPGPLPVDEATQYALDEPFRESQGLLQGDLTLNGTMESDPNWDASPLALSQTVRQGDLALFRVKGKLSNNAVTTLYTKLSQPGKNYPSYAIPGTNVDQYKALYIEQPDAMTWTFYNSTSYNTPLNQKSATFNYSFKTQALENGGEPNDDDNAGTIADRTLANNLPLGFVASRSVFQVDNSPLKDVEEWYKVTLNTNDRVQWRLATTPNQYSSWSFTMKMYTNGGNQVGSTVNVASTAATGVLEHRIGSGGTYYLQVVGTPISKSYTNMFYKPYTISACIPPEIIEIQYDASQFCPGLPVNFSASTVNGATGFSWNFGGGFTPNTSSSPNPTVTAGAAGEYQLTVTVSNGCSSKTYQYGYLIGCTGQVGVMGAASSDVLPTDLIVESSGATHLLAYFSGNPDLDPGAQTFESSSTNYAMALMQLSALGELQTIQVWVPTAEDAEFTPVAMDYDPLYGYRISGRYDETVDFNPGPGHAIRNDSLNGRNFLLALSPDMQFQWVVTLATANEPSQPVIQPLTGEVFATGAFSGTVDFDPGLGVFAYTSAGDSDAYVAVYDSFGELRNVAAWGGTGTETVFGADVHVVGLEVAGQYQGTLDMNPGPSTAMETSVGDVSGFVLQLSPNSALGYQDHMVLTGAGVARPIGGVVATVNGLARIAGHFSGTIDFDPNAGTRNRLSSGGFDAFVLSCDSLYNYQWVYAVGGAGDDAVGSLALMPGINGLRAHGSFDGTVEFDPEGPGASRTGTNAAFLVGLASNGNVQFASTWDGDFQVSTDVGVDETGIARGIGYFGGTVDFDPGVATSNVTSQGVIDGYLQILQPDGSW